MNELDNNIKKLRETKKMSRPSLANRLGITRSAISAYEMEKGSFDYLIDNSIGKDYINASDEMTTKES